MPTYLDLTTWPRKQHFDFFRGFDNPFFNVCVPVDVTALGAFCRAEGVSFFLGYLHLSTRAANAVESFRYRLRGDRVLQQVPGTCQTAQGFRQPEPTMYCSS